MGRERDLIKKKWEGMIARCYKEEHKSYSHYGARGIKVCEEWHQFESFYNWCLSAGYKEGLTLDRENVDKGYSPENCRLITNLEQQRNKRNTVYLTIGGITKPLPTWAEEAGISRKALRYRVKSKWPEEKLLEPVYQADVYEINGVKKTAHQWATEYGLTANIIISRYKHYGMRGEELIQPRIKNVPVEINGIEKTLPEWARHTGIDIGTLRGRAKRGDTGERLIRPARKIKKKEG